MSSELSTRTSSEVGSTASDEAAPPGAGRGQPRCLGEPRCALHPRGALAPSSAAVQPPSPALRTTGWTATMRSPSRACTSNGSAWRWRWTSTVAAPGPEFSRPPHPGPPPPRPPPRRWRRRGRSRARRGARTGPRGPWGAGGERPVAPQERSHNAIEVPPTRRCAGRAAGFAPGAGPRRPAHHPPGAGRGGEGDDEAAAAARAPPGLPREPGGLPLRHAALTPGSAARRRRRRPRCALPGRRRLLVGCSKKIIITTSLQVMLYPYDFNLLTSSLTYQMCKDEKQKV